MGRLKTLIILIIIGSVRFGFCETLSLAPDKRERIALALEQFERDKALAIETSFLAAQKKEAQEFAFTRGEKVEEFSEFLRYWHPYLEVETGYNDNIYWTKSRKSDIINTYTPGIKFLSLSEDNKLEINGGARLISYYHAWFNNTQNPFITFYWNKKFGRNYIKVDESFKYDATANSNITVNTFGFSGYQYNYFNISAGRELNLFSIEPSITRSDYFYRKDNKQGSDYNSTVFGLTGYYKFAPKTRMLFEFDYGMTNYPKKPTPSKNNKYEQFWFGVIGNITPKITGFMKAGYQFYSMNFGQDWDKPILGFDLDYQFKERTKLTLKIKKTAAQSTYSDQNFYEINRLDLGTDHIFAFNPKLNFLLSAYYENDDYPAPSDPAAKERIDNSFGVTSAFNYKLQKWFSVLLRYNWSEVISNVTAYSTVGHGLSVKLTGSF